MTRAARDVLAERLETWFGDQWRIYDRADRLIRDLDGEHLRIFAVNERGDVDDGVRACCTGDAFYCPTQSSVFCTVHDYPCPCGEPDRHLTLSEATERK